MSQDPDPSLPPSNAELRELIKNATGGHRTTDSTGVIRFGNGETLCHGDDHDVTWKSEADKLFVTRVTPYLLHILLSDIDSCQRFSRAKSILLRKHGIDPNGLLEIMNEDSFKYSEPL